MYHYIRAEKSHVAGIIFIFCFVGDWGCIILIGTHNSFSEIQADSEARYVGHSRY